MRLLTYLFAMLFTASLAAPFPFAFAADMPRIVQQEGRYALMVDGKPYLILGAQINNSSSWPAFMPNVWPTIEAMHANTVEAPVYWEQLEPQPGQFDFSTVDMLVEQARAHHVHLVLLWFGTWKNGRMHYTPDWVKTDSKRYPRMIGPNGEPVDVLSPNSPENLAADKQAFVALMQHVKQLDSDQHTILLMQVENESGSLGTVRDFSPMAQRQFDAQVPADFAKAMHKQPGTWKQVFGPDADEIFAGYSVSHYIDQIVAAGKAVMPLPMYCNVWQGSRSQMPGVNYPSGGAVIHMIDVWKATAHNIDVIGPDIYTSDPDDYKHTLAAYHRPDNALWIPETGASDVYGNYFYYALGLDTIGFSPFGVDSTGWTFSKDEFPKRHAENYTLIGPMDREIAQWEFEGKVKTAVEEAGQEPQTIAFGKWTATVSFGFPQYGDRKAQATSDIDGRVLIAQLGESEFVVTGFHARVMFHLTDEYAGQHTQILRAEQGAYDNGSWKMTRLWNGDQTDYGLNFQRQGDAVVRVTLGTY